MSFNVEFIVSRNSSRVKNGLLIYKPINFSRDTTPDQLNENGWARTVWHDDWIGKVVDVYCHTDGINSGTPAYVDRITLRSGTELKLKIG